MVGSALVRRLKTDSYSNFLLRTHEELDLLDQNAVNKFFATEKPDYVFLAAARVGGINANNTYRGQFIYENLTIQNNAIHSAHIAGVKKTIILGDLMYLPQIFFSTYEGRIPFNR